MVVYFIKIKFVNKHLLLSLSPSHTHLVYVEQIIDFYFQVRYYLMIYHPNKKQYIRQYTDVPDSLC